MADKKDALRLYREKRHFDQTPEPAEGGTPNEQARAFVVQKHWATRLHYDFRLELEGTMKSWAVPKGPSFDPADKRMAMPTEDHPIAYNQFEGTIPPGNYGAGKVIIWDKGVWIPQGNPAEAWRQGKLKFELRGHKLRGHWTLVRMRGRGQEAGREPWLLIKERDELARAAAEFSVVDEFPDSVRHLPDVPSPPGEQPAAVAMAGGGGAQRAARQPRASSAAAASAPAAKASASPPARKAQATKPPEAGVRTGAPLDRPPDAAVPAELPQSLQPQLATLANEPPAEGDWLYEVKFDGYRMLARAEGGEVRLVTRNGNDWTARMPQLVAALRGMDLPDGWYDGEIIVPGRDSPADFQALQGAFDSARTADIVYYLFDLPFCAGHDLREVPLEQRREVLQRIVERKPHDKVRFSAVFDVPVREMLASACQIGLEGVIAKRRDSAYVTRRSGDWLKLKCHRRQEFVIGGFTDPKGSRTGIGSLLLGVHGAQGRLHYSGNVGTGFDQKTLAALHARLQPLLRERAPFGAGSGIPRRANWVEPVLVCEVAFGEWTRDGHIRHSVFHGLRTDKPASAITREEATVPQAAAKAAKASGAAKGATASEASEAGKALKPGPSSASAKAPAPTAPVKPVTSGRRPAGAGPAPAAVALPASLRISNPQRIVDPQSGTTKIDLVRYYALVAPLMMPHLEGRPMAMVRAPNGIAGELFFQKHLERYKMAGVVQLDPAIFPGHPSMLEIAEPLGLLSAAQMNVVEFHTWNGVKRTIAAPDRMTFDIDPGEGVEWPQIQEAAQLVRAMLAELGLPAFLKTSGGKGLHVVVPLKPKADWDTVKDFSQAVVQHLARTLPDRFVAKSGPRNRVGRIFIDYLRNGYGATTACAWSARARPGLGISVPVAWDELMGLSSGAHWTVSSVHERLALGNSPWDEYQASRATLAAAMKTLGFKPAAR